MIVDMTVLESIPYALFCMAVVFTVLIVLSFMIKLVSLVINAVTGKSRIPDAEKEPVNISGEQPEDNSIQELRLEGVDEKTAALVMAIVADEAGIQPEELCFKSIKAI